jgi:hypothetical protein
MLTYFGISKNCKYINKMLLLLTTSKWGLAWAIDNEDKSYGRRAGTVFWGVL